jgi:hypothetical protein
MLRTIVIALALGAPAASAQQFSESAVGIEVRGDDGTLIGEVASVERNADGEIVATEIEGLEPADAPFASSDLVAENERDQSWIPASAREDSTRGGASTRTATR